MSFFHELYYLFLGLIYWKEPLGDWSKTCLVFIVSLFICCVLPRYVWSLRLTYWRQALEDWKTGDPCCNIEERNVCSVLSFIICLLFSICSNSFFVLFIGNSRWKSKDRCFKAEEGNICFYLLHRAPFLHRLYLSLSSSYLLVTDAGKLRIVAAVPKKEIFGLCS